MEFIVQAKLFQHDGDLFAVRCIPAIEVNHCSGSFCLQGGLPPSIVRPRRAPRGGRTVFSPRFHQAVCVEAAKQLEQCLRSSGPSGWAAPSRLRGSPMTRVPTAFPSPSRAPGCWCILLLGFCELTGRRLTMSFKSWLACLFPGLLLSHMFYGNIAAAEFIPAAVAALLFFIFPPLVTIINAAVDRRPPSPMKLGRYADRVRWAGRDARRQPG